MLTEEPTHILYYAPYSMCSIMVRYSYALRGQPQDANSEIRFEEKHIDIMNKEQLTEHYLCDINAAGEVPVIASIHSKDIIPDSVVITKYLSKSYPTLIPESKAAEIERLLAAIHSINFFSLVYTGKPQRYMANKNFLQKQLDSDISDRYRAAVEYKLKRVTDDKLASLEPHIVERNEIDTRHLMQEFESILNDSQTGWLFNLREASAVDAHLIVFIARMQDIKRENLIPESLRSYAAKAMDTMEWKGMMQGRKTVPPGF